MSIFKHKIIFGGLKHLKCILSFMMGLPMSGTLRWIFAKAGGVKFVIANGEKPWFFIGSNVILDSVYPENIIIHNGVHITSRCILLTHNTYT